MNVASKPKLRKIVDIPVGRINFGALSNELGREKALCAEPTGKGNLLIVEGFFGRMFRSDEGCVRDELDEYCRQYNDICRKLDEDPAHQYYEVMNYNDLYYLHGITPSIAGEQWGYANSEDYRVHLEFEVVMVTQGDWVNRFGEPYLYYEPKEWCYPDPCYMEV